MSLFKGIIEEKTESMVTQLYKHKMNILKLANYFDILFFQAPPGCGKTTAMWRYVCELTKKYVFLTFPNENYLVQNYKFASTNGNIGKINKLVTNMNDIGPLEKKKVFTTTNQVLINLLLNKDKKFIIKNIGYILIDEAHIIDTSLLSLVQILVNLYKRNIYHGKIIFLSATLINTVCILRNLFLNVGSDGNIILSDDKTNNIGPLKYKKMFWYNLELKNNLIEHLFVGDANYTQFLNIRGNKQNHSLLPPTSDDCKKIIKQSLTTLFILVHFYPLGDIIVFIPGTYNYQTYIDLFNKLNYNTPENSYNWSENDVIIQRLLFHHEYKTNEKINLKKWKKMV